MCWSYCSRNTHALRWVVHTSVSHSPPVRENCLAVLSILPNHPSCSSPLQTSSLDLLMGAQLKSKVCGLTAWPRFSISSYVAQASDKRWFIAQNSSYTRIHFPMHFVCFLVSFMSMCMDVLSACMSVYHVQTTPVKSERSINSLGIGVSDSC